jgi:hypothetical protein
MALKFTNIIHCKTLQNRYTQIWIFSLKIYHLATLVPSLVETMRSFLLRHLVFFSVHMYVWQCFLFFYASVFNFLFVCLKMLSFLLRHLVFFSVCISDNAFFSFMPPCFIFCSFVWQCFLFFYAVLYSFLFLYMTMLSYVLR